MMKTFKLSFAFVWLSLILSCSQEEYVRTYPQILSSDVSDISAAGVTANATISSGMIDKIIDCGFVWGVDGTLTVNKDHTISLGKPTSDTFTTDIRTGLSDHQPYFIRAYVTTDKISVYGEPVKFTSKGSEGLVISTISPLLVHPNDTITIIGKRFGTDPLKTTVLFTTDRGESFLKITSLSDTKIKVVSPSYVFGSGYITVSVKDVDGKTSLIKVHGNPPALARVTSKNLCDEMKFHGSNLLTQGTPTAVTVNNVVVTPLPAFTDSTFVVPFRFHAPNISVKISYTATNTFTYDLTDASVLPTVTGGVPTALSSSNTLTITGTNLPTCGGLVVSSLTPELGPDSDVQLTVTSITETSALITATGTLCGNFKVKVSYNDKILFVSDEVQVSPYAITSVSPLSMIHVGDVVQFNGTQLEGLKVSILGFGFDPMDPNRKIPLEVAGSLATQKTIIFPMPPDDYQFDQTTQMSFVAQKCNVGKTFDFTFHLADITIDNITLSPVGSASQVNISGTNFLSDPNLKVAIWTASGQFIDTPGINFKDDLNLEILLAGYSGETIVVGILSYGRVIKYPNPILIP